MNNFLERLPELQLSMMDIFSFKKNNQGEDPRAWASYMGKHRFFAVTSYILDKDREGFFEHLKKSVDYQIKLFSQEDEKRRLHEYRVPTFREVFISLCLGSPENALSLMEYIKQVDLNDSTKLATAFHKAFRLLILGTGGTPAELDENIIIFQNKYKSYAGYPLCFKAIYDQDSIAFQKGFEVLMKGHKVLSRANNEFGNTVDSIIALWPLGIVNLARMKGMDVMVDHPLIPQDLIVEKIGGLGGAA